MSYLPDDLSGQAAVAKEGYVERKKKENIVQRKLRGLIQKDEQKAINKHSEGVCYGCMKRDYIISSMFYCCRSCMEKRGHEALYTIITHKSAEELCDFCGKWTKPFHCYQINCSLCDTCWKRMDRFHTRYRKEGGKLSNPFEKRMRRKFGKDHAILRYTGRTVGI